MKSMLILIALIFASESFAVCSSSITRSNYSALQVLSASSLNTQLNTVYARANELPGDCITAESITTTQIDDGTILNADISASAAIARSKLGVSNYSISTSSSTFTTSSTTAVDVTNLSVTITTTGNPVELFLIGNDATLGSHVSINEVGATSAVMSIQALRGATQVGLYLLGIYGASGTILSIIPAGAVRFFDAPSAGTYTYKIRAFVDAGTEVGGLTNVKLVAREI